MIAVKVDAQDGTLLESYSFVSVNKDNIIIESIKKAEDRNDIIVRLPSTFYNKFTKYYYQLAVYDYLSQYYDLIFKQDSTLPFV